MAVVQFETQDSAKMAANTRDEISLGERTIKFAPPWYQTPPALPTASYSLLQHATASYGEPGTHYGVCVVYAAKPQTEKPRGAGTDCAQIVGSCL